MKNLLACHRYAEETVYGTARSLRGSAYRNVALPYCAILYKLPSMHHATMEWSPRGSVSTSIRLGYLQKTHLSPLKGRRLEAMVVQSAALSTKHAMPRATEREEWSVLTLGSFCLLGYAGYSVKLKK